MSIQARNFWSQFSRLERLSLLTCAGALVGSLCAEIRVQDLSVEISNTQALIGASIASPSEVAVETAGLASRAAALEARLKGLREEEKVARASLAAKDAAEAELQRKHEESVKNLSVRPDSKKELARRVSRAASICAANRSIEGQRRHSLGNESEAKLVLVRCVGECRRMEQDIPVFSEFLAELIIQFYGLDASFESSLRTLIADGFETIKGKSLASTDRPEQSTEGWESRSLEWESRRDAEILTIAKAMRPMIPQTHPYGKWLPSLLSISSGLRGSVTASQEGAVTKSAINVALPLSPEQ